MVDCHTYLPNVHWPTKVYELLVAQMTFWPNDVGPNDVGPIDVVPKDVGQNDVRPNDKHYGCSLFAE